MSRSALLPLIFALALPACAGRPAFTWPAPEGWRSETIPFPLGFAPDLPYRGLEEIRFAPAFFNPEAPGYFSYAFVWWLEGNPTLDNTTLERDLARYFAGLCGAVGGKKFSFDPSRFKATLAPGAPRAGAQTFEGTIDAYDPFEKGGGRELTLNVELSTRDCAAASRRVLMVVASPKPRSDAIWKELEAREAAFHCQ
jgi:hypothetical protein